MFLIQRDKIKEKQISDFNNIHNQKKLQQYCINLINFLFMHDSIYQHAAQHIARSFYIESFEKYFIRSSENFYQLSRIIKECNISDIHCRFNVWRLTLGVVSVNSTEQQKRSEITEQRKKYQQKKDQAYKIWSKKSPIKQPVKKNPLLMMSNPKPLENKEVQSDEFLKQQIHKDVERTYQEMKFFQEKSISKLLNTVLFVWCRRNPDVSYKQGMNELLASVVVCYFKEAEFKNKEQKPENVAENLWQSHLFFNSVEYAQSDIFSVFQKIIDIQGDMYKTEADFTIKSKVNPNSKNNTPILQRIIQIKDHKLKHMDLELFRILKLQDVQTKSFMLRWIRCMHTREFDLDNSFVIWDSIFLEFLESQNSRKNKQFQFIDAMCLAMFMYMRSIVFTKQTAGEILQVYQKFPALKRGIYLDELITLAWTICEELRVESQNIQASQSNWFDESSKIKALHFMDKKEEKKQVQQIFDSKPKQASKKTEPSEKQLTQTTKQPEIHKKLSEPLPVHKGKQQKSQNTESKPKTQQNDSTQKIKELPTQKPTNVPNESKKIIKITSAQDSKLTKQQEFQNGHSSSNNQGTHSTLIGKQSNPIPKVAQNVSIQLSSSEIYQILQNLNESLSKIRDIDVQSLIRRTIKKIQTKVKQVKQKSENHSKSEVK